MTDKPISFNYDQIDQMRQWLEAQHDVADYQYAEFEVAYGALVWFDWSMDYEEPSLSVNMLLTEEPHYVKRSFPRTPKGAVEDIILRVEEILHATDFASYGDVWELNKVSGVDLPNYDTWVDNPNYEEPTAEA